MSEPDRPTRLKANDCIICLEPLSEALTVVKLCGHVFHSECLSRWISQSPKCPLCKARIRTKDLLRLQFEISPLHRPHIDGEAEAYTIRSEIIEKTTIGKLSVALDALEQKEESLMKSVQELQALEESQGGEINYYLATIESLQKREWEEGRQLDKLSDEANHEFQMTQIDLKVVKQVVSSGSDFESLEKAILNDFLFNERLEACVKNRALSFIFKYLMTEKSKLERKLPQLDQEIGKLQSRLRLLKAKSVPGKKRKSTAFVSEGVNPQYRPPLLVGPGKRKPLHLQKSSFQIQQGSCGLQRSDGGGSSKRSLEKMMSVVGCIGGDAEAFGMFDARRISDSEKSIRRARENRPPVPVRSRPEPKQSPTQQLSRRTVVKRTSSAPSKKKSSPAQFMDLKKFFKS